MEDLLYDIGTDSGLEFYRANCALAAFLKACLNSDANADLDSPLCAKFTTHERSMCRQAMYDPRGQDKWPCYGWVTMWQHNLIHVHAPDGRQGLVLLQDGLGGGGVLPSA